MANQQLKQVVYQNWGYPGFDIPQYAHVAYLRKGKRCVFSGISLPPRTSTINNAEVIIKAICFEEQVHWKNLIFFDLQTHSGYPSKETGFVEYDQLTLEEDKDESDKFRVRYWHRVDLPADIHQAFREYIGPFPDNISLCDLSFDELCQKVEPIARSGKYRILKPEEAWSLGYCAPNPPGSGTFDLPWLQKRVDQSKSDMVIVDNIGHPNLLAQAWGRFAVWEKT